jgi:hypothetical protein
MPYEVQVNKNFSKYSQQMYIAIMVIINAVLQNGLRVKDPFKFLSGGGNGG